MTASNLPDLETLSTRRLQMFPTLDAKQIARIARYGTEKTFEAGHVVFEQGDRDVPFYVVLDGELEVVHPRGDLEEPIVTHRAGDFTGEINLINSRRSLVRGRALTELRVICLEPDKFRALIQSESELSELFMRAFILRRIGLFVAGQGDAVVLGSQHSAATLRLQAFLTRNSHPHRYIDVDREADVQAMLDGFHVTMADIPVLICRGTRVLKNPTNAEVADCLEFNHDLVPCAVHDVIICGAGPAGLAAGVYGASEGLDVMVLESTAPGGQAGSSSKIENYLGFPTGISGQALAARAFSQAEKFGATIAIARTAKRLWCDEVPLRVELTNGESIKAHSIIVATGAEYRKLEVENLARFEGVGVYYAATYVEASRCGVEEIIVVGGGNSAGQAATFLARESTHVHIFIRGPNLAASMSRYLIQRIEDAPNITLHKNTQITALDGEDHLERVTYVSEGQAPVTKPIRHVFSMAGAKPNTEWLEGCLATDPAGFVLAGADLTTDVLKSATWPLARTPYLFETSKPKVFAVGDVRANSVKRVASGVGEGSVCIQLVHRVLAE